MVRQAFPSTPSLRFAVPGSGPARRRPARYRPPGPRRREAGRCTGTPPFPPPGNYGSPPPGVKPVCACRAATTGKGAWSTHTRRRAWLPSPAPVCGGDHGNEGGLAWDHRPGTARTPRRAPGRAPYSRGVQQRRRPGTPPASRHRTTTCPNDHQRPRHREFASRGSGVQIPSAPRRSRPVPIVGLAFLLPGAAARYSSRVREASWRHLSSTPWQSCSITWCTKNARCSPSSSGT